MNYTPEEIKEVNHLRENVWDFMITRCKTKDKECKEISLIPQWKFLKSFVHDLIEHRWLLELKARQLMISTVGMAFALHKLYYGNKGWTGKVITIPELYYDGTYNSLFGRIEFMHSKMPKHIKQELVFKKKPAIIINPRNGNTLLASTTTVKAGRGGTYDWLWVDEAAILEEMLSEIMESTIPATECGVIVSTPKGMNTFYKLVKAAREKENDFYLREDDWKARPDHNLEWFKKKTRLLTPVQIAQEYLLDFETSQEGRVFRVPEGESILKDFDTKEMFRTIEDKKENRKREEKYKDWQLTGGADYGLNDETIFVIGVYNHKLKRLHIVGLLTKNNKLPEQIYIDLVKLYMELFNIDEGLAKQKLKLTRFFGDPSGDNRTISTGTSIQDDYVNLGLNGLVAAAHSLIKEGIKTVQRWLSDDNFFISSEATKVLSTLISCHYPFKRGVITTYDKYADPGNFNCHIMDATRYLLHSISEPIGDAPDFEVLDSMTDDEIIG